METEQLIRSMGQQAREASHRLVQMSSEQRASALCVMADSLAEAEEVVLEANAKDLECAATNGLSKAMIDRLRLDGKRLGTMAEGIRSVASLPDPVGQIISEKTLPNGLQLSKVRTPIGTVGIIYESRPNVTSDAGSLCLRTGNAVILRGGSESIHSNKAIASALQLGAITGGFPEHALQLVPVTDRAAVKAMAEMDDLLDVIVPRGGHSLIRAVVEHARMPVIKHYHGVCATYVDRDADLQMAARIVANAKCQRPGVCNALETLLVHKDVVGEFVREVTPAMEAARVVWHVDEQMLSAAAGAGVSNVVEAKETDWTTEYLDYELAAKVVGSVEEAIAHINQFGSHHSDAIITRDEDAAERFLRDVDSAAVYWNASTRFTDGGQFGFGAEIGISTDKLPARGPMGLQELTTYKYVVRGEGHIRQ